MNQIFNSFSLVGNVAKVNETKEQANGTKFKYFTICQNTKYKDKNGEEKEEANFFDIKIFEKYFKTFDKILEVGKFINVIGKVKVYKDNSKKTKMTLIGCDARVLEKEKAEELFDYDWLNDNGSKMEV